MNIDKLVPTIAEIQQAGIDYPKLPMGEAISLATVKKVMAYMDEHNHNEGIKAMFYLSIPLELWLEIKKALEATVEKEG